MAYALAADVALFLGRTLSADQTTEATALLAAASAYVDRYTGQTWVAATVTGEIQTVRDGMIRLDRRPISGVTTVSVRGVYLGASSTVLTSPTGYEIINAAEGQLLIGANDGAMATVTYTAAPTVPDDIEQATIMLASYWLGAAITPAGLVYSKIKSDEEELTYRNANDKDTPIPPSVQAILNGYRSAFAFA